MAQMKCIIDQMAKTTYILRYAVRDTVEMLCFIILNKDRTKLNMGKENN